MTAKKMKIFYYWPIVECEDAANGKRIFCLKDIIEYLDALPISDRVYTYNNEIVQLKKTNLRDNKWYLSFMKLKDTSPYKTKLDNEGDVIILDDDEYIGEEVCAIYDIESRVIAIQNNRYSLSYNGMSMFFLQFINLDGYKKFTFQPLTYPEKYTDISDDPSIKYKSISLSFIDVTKLIDIGDNNNLTSLGSLARDLNALTGKMEFSVGRVRDRYLIKNLLKTIVGAIKEDKSNVKSLKVKMLDDDNVRLIDLINYKLEDEITINIAKDDPKTFDKIFTQMDSAIDVMLTETLGEIPKIYVNA